MAYLVSKTTIEENTGLVTTTAAGHLALHNDKAKAVNSLTDEMIDSRNPALATPEATPNSVPDLLGQLKQQIKNITGGANWYTSVVGSIKGLLNATTGHKHTGAANDAPKIPTGGIGADAVISSKIADDAVLPEHLEAGAGTSWAWKSWTPSWTNLDVQNGTLNYAKYIQIGKTVHFRLKFTWGSNTSIGGSVSVTLPVDMHGDLDSTADMIDATAMFFESGVDTNIGMLRWVSAGVVSIHVFVASAVYLHNNNLVSTAPFTWGINDAIILAGTYETP